MSKDEMVSVPRAAAEVLLMGKGGIAYAAAAYEVRQALNQAGDQHQVEPVAVVKADIHGHKAILLEAGMRLPDGTRLFLADPGEVERLRAEVSQLKDDAIEDAKRHSGMCEKLAERDALLRGLQSDLYEAAGMAQEIRDARPFASSTSIGAPYREFRLKDARNKAEVLVVRLSSMADALSASAEPSAPKSFIACRVDETCGGGVDTPKCETCSDLGIVGNILTAEPCPDCSYSVPVELDERAEFEISLPNLIGRKYDHRIDPARDEDGEYKFDPASTLFKGWKARAALERKP